MFLKDPADMLDYAVDWSASCADERTIAASSWTVEPDGLSLTPAAPQSARTEVRLAGGLAGALYRVSNRVSFSDGLVEERSMLLRVEQL